MPLLDFVSKPGQRVAYLFPEVGSGGRNQASQSVGGDSPSLGFRPRFGLTDVFVFQFWPSQVTDNYTPNYATKQIPGGSHPIFQWTGGSGRDISFTAQFVSEIAEDDTGRLAKNSDFRSRISSSAAVSPTSGPSPGLAGTPLLGPLLLPSARYTVNVAAAIAALQRYLYPDYEQGPEANSGLFAKPPQKLILVLPGTKLGRGDDDDGVLCIMRSANVTQESWFPSGELRAATVSLRFSEIVQRTAGNGNVSNIRYIGRKSYDALAQKYTSNVNNPGQLELSNV